MRLLSFIAVFTALLCNSVFSAEVKVSAKISPDKIGAGECANLSVSFSIPESQHIYAISSDTKNPDATATKIKLDLPKGFKLLSADLQKPSDFKFFGTHYSGYEKSADFVYSIKSPDIVPKNIEAKIKVSAEWLACSDTCVPGKAEIIVPIALTKSGVPENGTVTLWMTLAGSFLGGLILNLMPCVFPVLALKAMSFAQSSAAHYKERIVTALAYTLGIWVSFLALAWILAALRSAGESLGWGFQLQNPVFVAIMALLFFAMALSFAGAYEIGAGLGALGISNGEKIGTKKYLSAALSGMFAVLVASPCTAPFMGSAVGVALSSDASLFTLSAIFSFLSFGMATPYLILAAIPSFAKLMPRPGAWMEILKNILSIPLFASAIWLVWVFQKQTGDIVSILSAALLLAIGLRIYGIYSAPHYSKYTRAFALVCLVAMSATALKVAVPENSPKTAIEESKNSWSETRLGEMLENGDNVYVDFTASWCLTCQFNKTILNSTDIKKLFARKNIKILVGDWTDKNSEIFSQLRKFGRAGVPLNLLYSHKKPDSPIVLPAILTESAISEAVDKLPE